MPHLGRVACLGSAAIPSGEYGGNVLRLSVE
jgi:hypothetical protein